MIRRLFLPVVLIAATGNFTMAREWTDTTGKFKTEAEFVELTDGNVKLRLTDGRVVTVPLSKLSLRDQNEARRLTKAAAASKPASVPEVDVETSFTAQWSVLSRTGADGRAQPVNLEVIVHLKGAGAAAASHYGNLLHRCRSCLPG